ncbi:MAG TPA: hypothetical protein VF535_11160 [Allosphingosinicella sp.]
MALVLLAFHPPLQAQPPAPRDADVRLGWRPGWTETGITVAPGDTLSIRVRSIRGSANDRAPETAIDPATGRTANVPAREQRARGSLADTLLKRAVRQVIVGRVGEGPPFVVGRQFRQVMRLGGTLSLRWNVPREMAASERGFDVAIRVEPAPRPERKPEEPKPTNPSNPANPTNPTRPREPNNPGHPTNPLPPEPTHNTIIPTDPVPEDPPVEIKSVVEPVVDDGNVSQPEQNIVSPATPEVAAPAEPEAIEGEDRKTAAADGPETGLSGGQLALIAGGVAALLLVLAAAGVAVQRWRRRKLVNRTRSLLALSPKLDLGEGACRGGSLPADGPAASLRARLEEGAIRGVEGGGDG